MASGYLDKVGLAYFWNKLKSYFVKGNARLFVGSCSSAATATEKTVTCTDFKSSDLVKGSIISVYFDNTNSAAIADLKLNVNGTGAKSIKYIYNGSLSNIPSAGYLKGSQMYQFTYDGTYWVVQMIYNTNTDSSYNLYYSNCTAGPNGIKMYSLIMPLPDGNFESCTTTSGTGTTKTKNTNGFRPGVVLYANRSTDLASGSAMGNGSVYESKYLIDLRYSGNQGSTLTAKRPVYLCGSFYSDGLFYLDDNWITQTIPTSEDNKTYIFLGISYDTYRIDLNANNPMYRYLNGAFREINDIPTATTTSIGLMSSSDKQKLSSLPTNAALQEELTNRPYGYGLLRVQNKRLTNTANASITGLTVSVSNSELFGTGSNTITIKKAGVYKLTLSWFASTVTNAANVKCIGFRNSANAADVGYAAAGRANAWECIHMTTVVQIPSGTSITLYGRAEDANTTFRIIIGLIEPLDLI